MTALLERESREKPETNPPRSPDVPAAPGPTATAKPAPMWLLVALWFVAVVAAMALVAYGFGPLFQQRDQRALLSSYRADIERAVNESGGLPGVSSATKPPVAGAAVAILEIGAIRMQQVVVEGAGASETRSGPGHVPGTAGLGQPGNSAVVGRNKAFGGPFGRIKGLHPGDEILVSTTQGQSVYAVKEVRHAGLSSGQVDDLYGPSDDDRLTLVTSASTGPWNEHDATIVVATLRTKGFTPTPQRSRSDNETGLTGDSAARSSVVLALLAYGIVMGASVLAFRRLQLRTAYVLTTAPLLALTVVAAETLSKLFPAWM